VTLDRRIVLAAYLRSVRYENLAYAKRFIRDFCDSCQDSATHAYARHEPHFWNLHRVMAIKDEVLAAYLLSSRRNTRLIATVTTSAPSWATGSFTPPEPARIHLSPNAPPLQAQTRPGCCASCAGANSCAACSRHARQERAFRDWYFDLADQFVAPVDAASYATWLKILRLPEEATGYREVRYPEWPSRKSGGGGITRLARSPCRRRSMINADPPANLILSARHKICLFCSDISVS